MTRTVYINGRYSAPEDATVSIFDRGLLFADAIYEVAAIIDSRILEFESHMQRLDRSLAEMGIPAPLSHEEILDMMRELARRNNIKEGLVYMQITRGSDGDRDFLPSPNMTPTVFAFAQAQYDGAQRGSEAGIKMQSAADIRWGRRDIKTVGLMGSVFARMETTKSGASEALLHQDGYVTEGSATSFYIIKDGTIITHPLSNDILPGCTRKALLALVKESDVGLDERLFTLEEVWGADEAFITGSSTYVCPVV